jgi:hypothetical protein
MGGGYLGVQLVLQKFFDHKPPREGGGISAYKLGCIFFTAVGAARGPHPGMPGGSLHILNQ